jgi:phosphotriesterase-related protein
MNRRDFVASSLIATGGILAGFRSLDPEIIMTVNGPIDSQQAGFTLSHEHILVEFSGAENYDPKRWDHKQVIKAVLPHLTTIKANGCDTLMDFTPEYLGRDAPLLKSLSTSSGLNIITNTGYYGAVNNKYLPSRVLTASADELSKEWISEFDHGIADTGIKPGFIKISVNPGALSEIHRRLVEAACLTHLSTGMVIASHTGPATPAFQQLDVLRSHGVHPSAFIWVHAQNEEDKTSYVKAAKMGTWISLDGIQEDNCHIYLPWIQSIKEAGYLDQLLISQDAGWYEPGKPWKGPGRKYTAIFSHLIPILTDNGFTADDIHQLFTVNPSVAFTIRIRRS